MQTTPTAAKRISGQITTFHTVQCGRFPDCFEWRQVNEIGDLERDGWRFYENRWICPKCITEYSQQLVAANQAMIKNIALLKNILRFFENENTRRGD